jgi:hypothetical protein
MSIEVEIENVFSITNRGKFVAVRLIDPVQDFCLNNASFSNGVELENVFDMPRALDKNGNQRLDLIIIQLKNESDAEKLIPGTITEIVCQS